MYADKEKKQLRDAEYRAKNREKIRQWNRDYYQREHEKRLASRAKSTQKHYESVREDIKIRNRQRRQKVREQLLDALGRKCARCGYDADVRALQIDHVNGGGCKERKDFPSRDAYYNYILQSAKDGAYQILCANCNVIKRIEEKEHGNGPARRTQR